MAKYFIEKSKNDDKCKNKNVDCKSDKWEDSFVPYFTQPNVRVEQLVNLRDIISKIIVEKTQDSQDHENKQQDASNSTTS